MKIIKLIVITSLLFAACKKHVVIEDNQEENITQPDSGLSYLALGDSYTIGQNVTADQRWPVLLVKDLKKNGKQVRRPDIIATTGWLTTHLIYSLNANPPVKRYDLVSLLIGVNNQYQGLSIEQYRKEFRELLTKCTAYTGGDSSKVFVLSIPDWGVTLSTSPANRDRIAKDIDHFNEVAQEECTKQNILFIDITPISRQALDNPSMIASDGLHFSGKMHQLWVDKVSPIMQKRIGQN